MEQHEENLSQVIEQIIAAIDSHAVGDIVTVASLMADAGLAPENYDTGELFEITERFHEEARRRKIKFGDAPYDGIIGGLPFEYRFVIKKK